MATNMSRDIKNAAAEQVVESRTPQAPAQISGASSHRDLPEIALEPHVSHQSQVDAHSARRITSAHGTPSPAHAAALAEPTRAATFVVGHLLLSVTLTFVLGGLSQFLLGLFLLENRRPYTSITARAAMPATVVGSVLIGSFSALAWTAIAYKLHIPFIMGRMTKRRYFLPVMSTSAGSFFVGAVGCAVVPPRGATESGFGVVHALVASAVGLVAWTVFMMLSCVMSLVWFV